MAAGAHEQAWAPSMQKALALAVDAGVRGDVPVGAVVVDAGGQVIGSGATRREADVDPLAHAEVLALPEPSPAESLEPVAAEEKVAAPAAS